MPNTLWADQVLCTVADVRARLNSPETALYLNRADDTPIGISSVAGNVITTGAPHNLLANNVVQFTTTGTLPSPLTAGTSYYVTATNLTQTAFSVSTIKGGSVLTLTGSGTGTNAVVNYTVDAVIQEKINTTKDWIRQDIQVDIKQRIPELVDSWLSYKRFQINRSMQNIRRDIQQISDAAGLPTIGIIGFDGTIFDLFFFLTQFPQIHPRTYSNYGVPTNGVNGTMAGSCFVGDILVDTLNWRLYINKGTQNSPLWKAEFTAQDAMNNLLNVGTNGVPYNELKKAAVECCIWAMAQDGMFRNSPNFNDPVRAQFNENSVTMWQQMYKSTLKSVIPLLEIDIDGDGVLSDYERGIVSNEIAVIG